MHDRIEYLVARLAVIFGAIHRNVRVAQDVVRVLVAGRAQSDADARGGVNLISVEAERLRQLMLHALGDANRNIGIIETVEQDGELITAEPSRCVHWAQAALDAARDGDEQLIASGVAETVVDIFEAVEVKQHQRDGAAVASGGEECLRRAVLEESPVRKPG